MPLRNPRTHLQQHALDAGTATLFSRRLQGLVQGQVGLHQRRQLPGQQRQVAGTDTGLQQGQTPLGFTGDLAVGRVDLHRAQALAAQLGANLSFGVALQHTANEFAVGIECPVAIRSHSSAIRNQATEVTRRTSAILVSPASTRRRPSDSMPG